MKTLSALIVLLLATAGSTGVAFAQEAGTSASVVLSNDLGITLDGDLGDWNNIPSTTTVSGPQPSADPGTTGRLAWQVAADQTNVYFAATITDANIIAGQHEGNYWNEDSFEFYVNFSGDLAAPSYGPGVIQVRIAAADIGTGGIASLSGIGLDEVDVSGVVFETEEGWGTEIAVDVSRIAEPLVGDRFGLQIQANGASTLDRDLKVSWSARDVADTSFEDPSVFGQGVFVDGALGEATAENPPETASVEEAAVVGEAAEVDSILSEQPQPVSGNQQQRSLLYAAIASSVSVFGGGLWFERKRRKDEERHAAAKEAAFAEFAEKQEPDEDEFQEMLESILDEGVAGSD